MQFFLMCRRKHRHFRLVLGDVLTTGEVQSYTALIMSLHEISQIFIGQNPDKYSRNIHGYPASAPLKFEGKIIGI